MNSVTASPRDIVRNNVKEKLARGEVVASMIVRLVRSVEIARIAKTAGFDSLYVDVEHSSASLETTSQICIAALEAGIAPFVRVPSIRPEHVSRVLDGGALGVIAPHIRSAAEAREVVRAAKFPPLGERSAAGALPHLHYRSFPAAEANAAMNEATMVVVQFETADAVERADEIAACKKHGKHVGVGGLATRPKLAAEFVKMGARYVSTGTDLSFLLAAATEKAKQVQEMKP
jgi:4-hydroxy-2-oxoheptanedioate aldolase